MFFFLILRDQLSGFTSLVASLAKCVQKVVHQFMADSADHSPHCYTIRSTPALWGEKLKIDFPAKKTVIKVWITAKQVRPTVSQVAHQ